MKKDKNLSEILYLTAFALWLFVALVKYTYFKDYLPMSMLTKPFFYTALVLLLLKMIRDFRFSAMNVMGLVLTLLFMTIAYAGGRLQFAVMFALIYSAERVPLKKILTVSLCAQILLFLATVTASQMPGGLEDYIWEATTRKRHGLGFTHCMLASHFGLFMSLIYIAIVEKITAARAAVILGFNFILYYFTDGRTDMYLAVLFVILAFVFGNLGEKLKYEKRLGIMSVFLTPALCAASILVTKLYVQGNAVWDKLNLVLNDRLRLGSEAIAEYGFKLFGEDISWVGASVLYYRPNAVYNYVDNSYLMMIFSYGVLFVFCYCVAMSCTLYRQFRDKNTMLIVCLVVILAFGVINPQSMYLTYNPFLVMPALCFGAWGRDKEVTGN